MQRPARALGRRTTPRPGGIHRAADQRSRGTSWGLRSSRGGNGLSSARTAVSPTTVDGGRWNTRLPATWDTPTHTGAETVETRPPWRRFLNIIATATSIPVGTARGPAVERINLASSAQTRAMPVANRIHAAPCVGRSARGHHERHRCVRQRPGLQLWTSADHPLSPRHGGLPRRPTWLQGMRHHRRQLIGDTPKRSR